MHFKSESSSSRRALISLMTTIGVQVRLYDGSTAGQRAARTLGLQQLVEDLAASGARRLIIERDESLEAADRRTVLRQLVRLGYRERLAYDHCAPHEEPLLWVSDAVAWCRQAGGEWRRRAAHRGRDSRGA